MGKKIFKDLNEQIEIFRSKGLVITDEEKTKDILLRENYFFINGYRHLFMKSWKDVNFIPGTTFEELYAMFVFDRRVRNIFFKNLLIIENNIKSLISHQLSKNYGFKEKDYLNPKNFTKDSMQTRQVHDVLNKVKRQIRVNGKQHNATKHYMQNYGYLPLWIVVKVLSFGIVSELYGVLQKEDQEEIASYFNLSVADLLIYLPILSNYRNLCAHEDICFEHKSHTCIRPNKYHSFLSIPKVDEEYIYGLNDMFALIIILKEVLRKNDFNLLMNEVAYEIDILDGKLKTIDIIKVLDRMGFPPNYRELADL